jgi:hypothetical protein
MNGRDKTLFLKRSLEGLAWGTQRPRVQRVGSTFDPSWIEKGQVDSGIPSLQRIQPRFSNRDRFYL